MSNDVFGFDDLQKSFNRIAKNYANKEEALIRAAANTAAKRLKQASPVSVGHKLKGNPGYKGGNFKKGWGYKYLKQNTDGVAAQVKNESPHGHLVNYGHRMVTHKIRQLKKLGSTRNDGKIKTRAKEIARGQREVGFVEGNMMLAAEVKKINNELGKQVEVMFDKVTKEVRI